MEQIRVFCDRIGTWIGVAGEQALSMRIIMLEEHTYKQWPGGSLSLTEIDRDYDMDK